MAKLPSARAGIVSSHAGLEFPSTSIPSAADLERSIEPETALVALDEAQFFGMDLLAVTDRLARRGIDLVVAGLDVTFSGEPFEPLPSLMALAERVDKLTAVCTVCGADAIYHQRIRELAISARIVPCSAIVLPKATRDLTRRHIASSERSATPISRMQ